MRATAYPQLTMPVAVERSAIRIWSDGLPLDGDIYRPKNLSSDQRVPAVVLSHGWGGDKTTAERYAAKFAEAGFIALCFSYAGWASSGSRAVSIGELPEHDAPGEVIARVRAIREVVDPVEWLQNFRSAVDFVEGEPNVDPTRIGAWGTSFGGGIALHHAANDPRIKVLVVQVASLASVLKGPLLARARLRAIDIARGRASGMALASDAYPGLAGTPHLSRFLQYSAIDEVGKIKVPTLVIDAANEELFDIRENGAKAYAAFIAAGSCPAAYKVIEGINHYGIYFEGYDESSTAALDWFSQHL